MGRASLSSMYEWKKLNIFSCTFYTVIAANIIALQNYLNACRFILKVVQYTVRNKVSREAIYRRACSRKTIEGFLH